MAYIVIPVTQSSLDKLLLNPEKSELYEQQIKSITEDFHREREDRVKACQRLEDLQDEVKRLQSHLEKQRLAIYADRKPRVYECDSAP